MKRWKKFLDAEIGIEFKAALYFYTILFFYFAYRLYNGSVSADIVIVLEMIATTYIMGYVQVFLLHNFDEAETFTWKEAVKVAGCSGIYVVVSYLGGWFDRKVEMAAIYFVFMLFCYGCVYWLYSVKLAINTKALNKELKIFKQKKNRKDEGHGITD